MMMIMTMMMMMMMMMSLGVHPQVVLGSSHSTISTYAAMHPDTACDVIFVDGGHKYHVSGATEERPSLMPTHRMRKETPPPALTPQVGTAARPTGCDHSRRPTAPRRLVPERIDSLTPLPPLQDALQDLLDLRVLANRTSHALILDDSTFDEVGWAWEASPGGHHHIIADDA
jgi:hypothetical protein